MDNIVTNSPKSKRVAINSIVLFVRMIFITSINLFTVRLTLTALGETDYGTLNAILGFVAIGSCISSVLATSTQRFLSYALGNNNISKLRDIFSVSQNLVVLLTMLTIIVLGLCGPWFIENKMTISPSEIPAIKFLFHCSLVVFFFSSLQIPFLGAIFAHEDMGGYTLISLADCILKMLLAWSISFIPNKLYFYGIGVAFLSFLLFISYALFARLRYQECKYKINTDKELHLSILSFSSWTLYGAVAGTCMIQGSALLLNVFFGPVINTAYAVSNQMYNAFNTLTNSVFVAIRPAMIKAYSSNEHNYLEKLFNSSSKIVLYLLIIISIPFIIEIRPILQLWLGYSNESMVLFSRLCIVFTLCLALQNPITTIIQATGNIRNYFLVIETMMMSCLPISWLLFKLNFPSHYIYIVMIGICLISHFVRLYFLSNKFPAFSIKYYCTSLLIPALCTTSINIIFMLVLCRNIHNALFQFCAVCITSFLLTLLITYNIGLDKTEKSILKSLMLRSFK